MFEIETNRITTCRDLYCQEKGGHVSYVSGLKTNNFYLRDGIYHSHRHALTDGLKKHDFLRSDNFMQCVGIIGVSEKLHHQLAHICPGKWISKTQHTQHLIKFYKRDITRILYEWKNHSDIIKDGIYLFGGMADTEAEDGYDSYTESRNILSETLTDVFGFAPQIAHGPSHRGERQFVRMWQNRARILIGNFSEE